MGPDRTRGSRSIKSADVIPVKVRDAGLQAVSEEPEKIRFDDIRSLRYPDRGRAPYVRKMFLILPSAGLGVAVRYYLQACRVSFLSAFRRMCLKELNHIVEVRLQESQSRGGRFVVSDR